MAEYGAHLTSAAMPNNERPSFFEVLAQESLMSTLRPALKHIIRILAETNPQRLGWMFRYAEELYTIVNLILQHHFLRTTSASFAENFYGMKRVPADSSNRFDPSSGLPYNRHIRSLLLLVVAPYLKLWLDAVFERWQQQFWDRPRRHDAPKQRMQRIFLTIYPFLHMTWEGVILSYQLKYLFHKSDCHSPFLHVAGVQLKYLSRDDIAQQTQATHVYSFKINRWQIRRLVQLESDRGAFFPILFNLFLERQEDSFSIRGRKITNLLHSTFDNYGLTRNEQEPEHLVDCLYKRGMSILALSISHGLSVGVFFLQFLEWWYMSDSYQTQIAVNALPIPDPPKKYDELLVNNDLSVSDANICPICSKPRTNDTVLATSGYVFCYPCIFNHVKSHMCCPITRYPSESSHLVKLYPPDG